MAGRWRDAEHLIRLGVVFLCAVIGFLVVRAALIPADFGRYGHYRPGALDDARNRPLQYAGRQSCTDCHQELVQRAALNAHAPIACETCHGPSAAHVDADDPQHTLPSPIDQKLLCTRCHAADPARPTAHPQVDPQNHYDGACSDCHDAHAPR